MVELFSKKPTTILIKTYLTESGLFYLAHSLRIYLKSLGHNVIFVPKRRFVKNAQIYKPSYPIFNNPEEFRLPALKFSTNIDIAPQIIEAINTHKAEYLISFETLMQKSGWVSLARQKTGVKVIDIPMIEWVTPQYLSNNSYSIFNEVWTLTDQCFEKFNSFNYKNIKKVRWDFVDRGLFQAPSESRENELMQFYHAGSISDGHTTKNTDSVIRAFIDFSRDRADCFLKISGKIKDPELRKNVKNHTNIMVLDNILSRQEIAALYQSSHCIIAPSSQEGLGLSLFEAKASGCQLITSDIAPMKEHSKYLCKVKTIKYDDRSVVPWAVIEPESIYEQLEAVYKDFKMSDKVEVQEQAVEQLKKTADEIAEENQRLAAALQSQGNIKMTEDTKPRLDPNILAKLKAKTEAQQGAQPKEETVQELVTKQDVSINLCFIGVGQAGSRVAEEFHKLGYDVGVINTSLQDLKYINVLDNQKLHLEGTIGGTGKNIQLSEEVFDANKDKVQSFVSRVIESNDMVYGIFSGGGGTGSGSVQTLVPMLHSFGKPVGIIFILPKASEDSVSKANAVTTLSKLARMTKEDLISSLIVVDNAKIEQIYGGLSQAEFWSASNKAIVEPMHLFNTLTSQPSAFTSLDPSDFGKIIACGDCSIYGVMEVENYMEETALAEAAIGSLTQSMLAEGFDFSQTRVGGVIITGSEKVLNELPAVNIDYCHHILSEQTKGASLFQGAYAIPGHADHVKVYSWFAGLGLPADRVESLKKESQALMAVAGEKEKSRIAAMTLDLEENKVANKADEIKKKIQSKNSGFNKLQGNARQSLIDKRRK